MISECYYSKVDPKLFDKDSATELWETLSETKLNVKDWEDKQYIDEEIVNHILTWVSPNELIEVEEEYHEINEIPINTITNIGGLYDCNQKHQAHGNH